MIVLECRRDAVAAQQQHGHELAVERPQA